MRVAVDRGDPAVHRIRLAPGEAGGIRLDPTGVAALDAAVAEAEAGDECRAVVLEGTDGVFCEGLDLRAVVDGVPDAAGHVHAFAALLGRLRRSPRPVVAVVDGAALGGGVGLAAAADLVVATARATFALPEVALGLVPAVVLPVLHERLGPRRARWLALTSGIDARRAVELGLADTLVEDPALLERTLRPILRHLLRARPEAVAALKTLGDAVSAHKPDRALQLGADHTAALVSDPERVAAIRAFLEGEPAPWWRSLRGRNE